MKSIASKVGTAAVLLFIAFFGLKGCVVTIWSPPTEPTTYAIQGSDGRTLSMIFLPKNETIFLHTDPKAGFSEVSLTKMHGTYGTHYFWRLWHVEGPGIIKGPLGLRLYPDDAQPVVMETTVLKKLVLGSSPPSLPAEGKTTYPVIVFFDNALRFEGMFLQKYPTDVQRVQKLIRQLNLHEDG